MIDGLGFNKLTKSLSSYIIFTFGSFASVCMNIIKNFYNSDVFINENALFDVLMTLYIRKNLSREVKIYLNNV